MLHHKMVLLFFCLFASAAVLRMRLVRVAAKSATEATEATAGFALPVSTVHKASATESLSPRRYVRPGSESEMPKFSWMICDGSQ
jgi:hypothetical protein